MTAVETLKELALPFIEQALEKAINEKFDAEFDKAVEALKEKIQNDQLDQVVELLAQHFKPALKQALLVKVEAISDKV
jgi:hypothetical protein